MVSSCSRYIRDMSERSISRNSAFAFHTNRALPRSPCLSLSLVMPRFLVSNVCQFECFWLLWRIVKDKNGAKYYSNLMRWAKRGIDEIYFGSAVCSALIFWCGVWCECVRVCACGASLKLYTRPDIWWLFAKALNPNRAGERPDAPTRRQSRAVVYSHKGGTRRAGNQFLAAPGVQFIAQQGVCTYLLCSAFYRAY